MTIVSVFINTRWTAARWQWKMLEKPFIIEHFEICMRSRKLLMAHFTSCSPTYTQQQYVCFSHANAYISQSLPHFQRTTRIQTVYLMMVFDEKLSGKKGATRKYKKKTRATTKEHEIKLKKKSENDKFYVTPNLTTVDLWHKKVCIVPYLFQAVNNLASEHHRARYHVPIHLI